MHGIVYMAVSPSGKAYVGQTAFTLAHRRRGHSKRCYLKNDSAYHNKFSNALRKYGPDAFVWSVLHDNVATSAELDRLEKAEIQARNTVERGYNHDFGGLKTKRRMAMSDATKAKLRAANIGKTLSTQTKSKISESNTGLKRTGQALQNIREANKAQRGRACPAHVVEALRAANTGRRPWNKGKTLGPQSEETKAKKSTALKGRTLSVDHRKKIALAHSGKRLSEAHKRAIRRTKRLRRTVT